MKKRVLFITVLLIATMVFTSVLLAESSPILHIIEGDGANGGGCFVTATGQPTSPFPDNIPTPTCYDATASGPAGATVSNVTVDVAATHSWIGDLIFTVNSPDASNLTLMDRPGYAGTGFGNSDNLIASSPISFTDASANPAEAMGSNVTTNVVCQDDGICDYAPDDALSTLAGENVNGTWQFCVSDNAAGDTGSVSSFTFNISCTGGDPPAPALVLTKTVGLDPGVCATTSSIEIPAGGGGTDVTYCYYMTNTGNITFELHTVNDDQLGTLLGPDFPASVGPGGSAWFTYTTLITQATVNVADWTATDADSVYSATASSTAQVTQGAPTDVSLSSFGADSTSMTPIWLASLLVIILGFGLIIRRKLTE